MEKIIDYELILIVITNTTEGKRKRGQPRKQHGDVHA